MTLEPEERVESPRTGVSRGCELPDVGALVLWKSEQYVLSRSLLLVPGWIASFLNTQLSVWFVNELLASSLSSPYQGGQLDAPWGVYYKGGQL